MKKINLQFFKDRPAKSLHTKLLGFFIIYGLSLLALLWIMQLTMVGGYYEKSMEKKCRSGIDSISTLYRTRENLSYKEFCDEVGRISAENDIYFFLESTDGSFSISSSDTSASGRIFPNAGKILSDAKKMLVSSQLSEINFTTETLGKDRTAVVYAKSVSSKFRGPVYMYAMASLDPIGPALAILRSQLLVVSIVVLVLGIVVAWVSSMHLAKPMVEMSAQAKRLGNGDFDAHFEGADYNEINELAATLNDATAELKTSDELRKDLLANVSHDLRTPLTMIRSYAEMIRDISGDNREKREEHVGVIIEEADRLTRLVNDILLLSKVQSGAESFVFEGFDIVKAAEEILNTYRVMEQEGYTIVLDPPEKPGFVFGDEGKIKQVISNLVSNAIKYSDSEKYVRIYFEDKGGSIRLCVEDKGIGISEDLQERIWNRYQRSSKGGAREKEGSGLGLSICSEILKKHNAVFGLESKEGEGSCFWFELKHI